MATPITSARLMICIVRTRFAITWSSWSLIGTLEETQWNSIRNQDYEESRKTGRGITNTRNASGTRITKTRKYENTKKGKVECGITQLPQGHSSCFPAFFMNCIFRVFVLSCFRDSILNSPRDARPRLQRVPA